MTSQAPHAHRTLFALVAGLPEHKIRIISPDIGGGFGNKVPIYPGYVVATAASLLIGRPVKWSEDRTGNLISTGFARDYHMHGELAVKDGKIAGLRVKMLSDNGAFFADAQPTSCKAGLFHIVTGSYDIPAAHVETDGAYTNKAPGGVAYRCSFRVTEASYLIERLVQTAAYELGVDPVEFRRQNFIKPDQFPYKSATGFEYDSGDYEKAMDLALEKLGYAELRKEQEEARKEGRLIGIGIASFTEVVGAGKGSEYQIAGLRMNDGAELRIHPTGKAVLKLSVKSQGQGHETTFAQIVAEELGLQPEDIEVQEGDTDNTPYGLGTYASRSTPVVRCRDRDGLAPDPRQGAEDRRAPARGIRGRPRVGQGPLQRQGRARQVDDDPGHRVRRLHQRPRRDGGRARGRLLLRPAEHDVPVRDVRGGRGDRPRHGRLEGPARRRRRRLRRADQPDDRRGPDHGRPHRGLRDRRHGADHVRRGRQLHRLQLHGLPAPDRLGDAVVRAGETVTPSPHHPIGAKGIGESATVGSPAAYVNAVVDALAHAGVRNLEMPVTSDKVWAALQEAGLAE